MSMATQRYERSANAHEGKVRRIADGLRRHVPGRPLSLRKRSVSHMVPKARDLTRRDDKIDLSDLDGILVIDPEQRVCVAEAGATFVDLVEATMRYGLVPMVVPELKTITVGGAVAGCSIESTSFRVGGFHDTCVEYEVITAEGDVLTCRPDNENRLIFEMVHGTFGTLGVLSKVTFRLAPATPFVRVVYENHGTLDTYLASIDRHRRSEDVTFLDGMIHAPDHLVLAAGDFVSEAPYTNRYDWTKVYCTSTRTRTEDYLRTADYFFRYDRGVTNVHPKSAIGRLLFGKLMGSSQLLRMAHAMPWALASERPTVTLDVFVPFSKVTEFMAWYAREFAHFPLWCVPYRLARPYPWLSDDFARRTHDDLFLDLAIYGMEQPGTRNYHKLMEDKLQEIGGIKTLISHNYYAEADFWRTWNRPNYEAAKARTDPRNVFRDLYAKTCRAMQGHETATGTF
jgi:FAD/FMN-containing dehydrogenase